LDFHDDVVDLECEFAKIDGEIRRTLEINGHLYEESVPSARPDLPPNKDFFVSYLSGKTTATKAERLPRLNYIDLFCGGGGLSLGVHNAARFLGRDARLIAAADIDPIALKLVQKHFNPLVSRAKSVEDLVRYEADLSGAIDDFMVPPAFTDTQIGQFRGKIDLLVGGPPCQGHSNLNNRTRRFDPRNLLYLVMPAFAVGLKIPNVIIENVRNIHQAKEDVVGITKRILASHGYTVREAILNASDFGVAQNRFRHFLVASTDGSPNLDLMAKAFSAPQITFDDACGGMSPLADGDILESNSQLSKENVDRINFLHDKNEYDLPNEARPVCHQDDHTYPSVYGRIRGDLPMQTVTTGFSSPGRGRYIHPYERRVVNIREAGRIQAFPDWYWKPAIELGFKRAYYNKVIGDAVPSLLAYPLMASMFA
jgi:DNA (cytosine-5)-methyltransferase 1